MTTKNRARHALKYSYSVADRVLVDANVLISVFSGLEPPSSIPLRNYSEVFKRMRQAGTKVLLDVLVLSEFVNRCARRYFELAQSQGGAWRNFKDYRNSTDFSSIAPIIAQASRQVLALTVRIDHPFASLSDNVISGYSSGNHDLNDLILIDICLREKAMLLTNDTDFTNGGITVLTTHPRLLAACP
jgi:predicted nucleic acid-binding protein